MKGKVSKRSNKLKKNNSSGVRKGSEHAMRALNGTKLKRSLPPPNLKSEKKRLAKKVAASKAQFSANKLKEQEMKAKRKQDYEGLMMNAAQAAASYVPEVEKEKEYQEQSAVRRNFFRAELKKVMEESDIILEVLDARDPVGTRSLPLEEHVRTLPKKHLVVVLNKADLVPRSACLGWLSYFRAQGIPCVLFKAAQIKGVGRRRAGGDVANASHSALKDRSASVGVDTLRTVVRSLCPGDAIVGCVGYPNVGKSSIINSLAGRDACQVAPRPGCTRDVSTIRVSNHLMIVDSPGVILTSTASEAELVLRGAVGAERIRAPSRVISEIADMVADTDKLLTALDISEAYLNQVAEENQDATIMGHSLTREDIQMAAERRDVGPLLCVLARKGGRRMRGGGYDIETIAKTLLQRWGTGKVRFFRRAPGTEAVSDAPEAYGSGVVMPSVDGDAQLGVQMEAEARPEFNLHSLYVSQMKAMGGDTESTGMDVESTSDEAGFIPLRTVVAGTAF
ncbi:hypothetical protein KIPB_006717 [Kipferlia bialata]|uniref:G domain-containing protein n=1 Tax=Kipferlia bialata TaxID=797122 RepID=A0A9K3GJY8_9EUKA|nr:hypothetical protein KIPB_006717 [Kipferlia bialata]|eukprot:g6717.t1